MNFQNLHFVCNIEIKIITFLSPHDDPSATDISPLVLNHLNRHVLPK